MTKAINAEDLSSAAGADQAATTPAGPDSRSIVDRTSDLVLAFMDKASTVDPNTLPELIERVGMALRKVEQGGDVSPASRGHGHAAPAAEAGAAVTGPADTGAADTGAADTGAAPERPQLRAVETAEPAAASKPSSEASEGAEAGAEAADWMPEGSFGPQRPPWDPAVPIEGSYNQDYIWCLEDGRKMQMLKRHLRVHYGMTPEQYKRKWGLPDNYPMTADSYRKMRRKLAKKTGFQPQNNARAAAAQAASGSAVSEQSVSQPVSGDGSANAGGASAQASGGATAAQSTAAQSTAAQSTAAQSTAAQSKAAQSKAGGSASTGAKSGGAKSGAAKSQGAKSGTAKSGTAKSGSAKSGSAKSGGSQSGGSKKTRAA